MVNLFKNTEGILNTKTFGIFGRRPTKDTSPETVTEQNLAPKTNTFKKLLKKVSGKKLLIPAIVAALLVALVAVLYISGNRPSQLVQRQVAQQSVSIAKSIEFPIRGQDGKAIDDKLKMSLTTADKTKQILIKGQPATARSGKTFLIINLELDNPTQNKLALTPVELIRLVDATGKKFAPDVHNDKVSIEPLSTKRTRVGFVIDETATSFNLQIGEVSGRKDSIAINF